MTLRCCIIKSLDTGLPHLSQSMWGPMGHLHGQRRCRVLPDLIRTEAPQPACPQLWSHPRPAGLLQGEPAPFPHLQVGCVHLWEEQAEGCCLCLQMNAGFLEQSL